VTVEGGNFEGGEAGIRGDVSSQFISSILISAPYGKNDTKIKITTPLLSRPYVDMTRDIMGKFGGGVEGDYETLLVKAGQKYKGTNYRVEGDYSSASYFFALAAMTGSEITVGNLNPDSKQADRMILGIIKEMGASVSVEGNDITVKGNGLKGIEVDLSDAPDLLPTVAALGCRAYGETVIKNVGHARFKETDRIAACTKEFKKFGVEIDEYKDGMSVTGTSELAGSEVKSYKDHRMAMALAVLGACAEGKTVIEEAECIKISYPLFFKSMKNVGLEVQVK
ncbi:3-phosphoshikimate 1-carboxyvinyltransferase, partial [archaeon]|nr:3-phosphoshikimate 1-carboxyvinyltransferase [archaeon]